MAPVWSAEMNPKNAFWILDLSPDASPAEVERAGRKLVGLLEIGATSAMHYECPLGRFERDATMVREAMSALRDPRHRAKEACVAKLLTMEPDERGSNDDVDAPATGALLAAGYRGL